MALPVGVSTCTVTYGSSVSMLGMVSTISGELTADRYVVWEATGTRVGGVKNVITATEGSALSFSVPHVDQAGFITPGVGPITGWWYRLVGVITYTNGEKESFAKNFQVVEGETLVDLDLIEDNAPVLPAMQVVAPPVTSIAGLTGAVSAEDLGDALSATFARDTGTRSITLSTEGQTGTLVLRRSEARVDYALSTTDPATFFEAIFPTGFKPSSVFPNNGVGVDSGNGVFFTANVYSSGDVEYAGGPTYSGSGAQITGYFISDDPFPDAEDYPGVALP